MSSAANKGSKKKVLSEAELREKAMLYAKAVDETLSIVALGELLANAKQNLGGEYGEFRKKAQACCIQAVWDHFKEVKGHELSSSQKAAFRELGITSENLQGKLKEFSDLNESEFAEKFAKLIDIIKMDQKKSKEFFEKDNNALLFGLTAKAQELRTTKEQVERTLAIIMLTAMFCAGIAIAVAAATGLALPVVAATVGISGAAASLGISEVMLGVTTVMSLHPAVQASLVASGLAGLGMAYASYVWRFPEETSSKIQSAMKKKDAETFEEVVGNIKKFKI